MWVVDMVFPKNALVDFSKKQDKVNQKKIVAYKVFPRHPAIIRLYGAGAQ